MATTILATPLQRLVILSNSKDDKQGLRRAWLFPAFRYPYPISSAQRPTRCGKMMALRGEADAYQALLTCAGNAKTFGSMINSGEVMPITRLGAIVACICCLQARRDSHAMPRAAFIRS